jgi:hypothetical protein
MRTRGLNSRKVSTVGRTPGEEQHARWRLVVAVDGSEGSREALLWTARLARVMKAEIVAIHTVGDWDEQWQEWVDQARGRLLDAWCRPLRDAGIEYRLAVLEGGPMTFCPTSSRWEATSWSSGAGGSAAFANSSLVLQPAADPPLAESPCSSFHMPRSTRASVARRNRRWKALPGRP